MNNCLHKPVLVKELLSLFQKKPKNILDCTFGRGGHSLAFLNQYPQSSVLALDRDLEAVQFSQSLQNQYLNLKVLYENFFNFPSHSKKYNLFDLILMDLGASSPQLDHSERGFSFNKSGPLDMRMDQNQKFKASDIINSFCKKELIDLFKTYGEIKHPYPVVNDLILQRKKKRIENTKEFASIIQKHSSSRFYKHPATKWFLALRIAVNQELEGLKKCLPDYLQLLKPRGFLSVISFHSLEDRIAKQSFRRFVKSNQGKLFNKKIIRPSKEEREFNPRSRSAKLRIFQKY